MEKSQDKLCPYCNNKLENKRKKYCNERCKYWYLSKQRERKVQHKLYP